MAGRSTRTRSVGRTIQIALFVSSEWASFASAPDGKSGEVTWWVASLLGIGHMSFGVLIFYSLIFIAALNTLPIVARYAVSAAMCQVVIFFKLATIHLDMAAMEGVVAQEFVVGSS